MLRTEKPSTWQGKVYKMIWQIVWCIKCRRKMGIGVQANSVITSYTINDQMRLNDDSYMYTHDFIENPKQFAIILTIFNLNLCIN